MESRVSEFFDVEIEHLREYIRSLRFIINQSIELITDRIYTRRDLKDMLQDRIGYMHMELREIELILRIMHTKVERYKPGDIFLSNFIKSLSDKIHQVHKIIWSGWDAYLENPTYGIERYIKALTEAKRIIEGIRNEIGI